jgi:hypothetical protein
VVGEPKQQQQRETLNLGRPLDLESALVNECLNPLAAEMEQSSCSQHPLNGVPLGALLKEKWEGIHEELEADFTNGGPADADPGCRTSAGSSHSMLSH